MIKRRDTLKLAAQAASAATLSGLPAAALAAANHAGGNGSASGQRVLRYAFNVAETGFDPARINDLYSRTITGHIFEALYCYDHLARPPKIVPLVADGMPEVSADFRVWTVKVRPGIFYADDPAFKGKRRELVAEDFVYAFKRFADPATKSPLAASIEQLKFDGLWPLRQRAIETKQPFDYDRPIDGLRALDRYTVQFKLLDPNPRFIDTLAVSELFGGVAREVIEAYGEQSMEHPVGTGPFRLAQWRRSSLIVLERNPTYRERLWSAEPAANDAAGQAIAAKLKGRRVPLIDRVEISIIEEQQPRWLSFLNGQHDLIERVPPEFIHIAMPGRKVAPNLARQGIGGEVTLTSDIVLTYFNMEDPVVGGMEPAKVALRRAICLGVNIDEEIRLARRGMAIPAQSPIIPNTSAYDPAYKSEASEYNPAKAKALLDLYGYVDKDGDGYRERPDGSPLVLEYGSQPDQLSRIYNELWKKHMDAIGIRMVFKIGKWPEQLKAARSGKLQMWGVGSFAAGGDGQGNLARWYGPQAGNQNLSRFSYPPFDKIYDRMRVIPDGPERAALFEQAKKIAIAYAPYKLHVHRFVADMWYPKLRGYRRPAYWQEWWHMVDVEPGPSPA